MISVNYSDSYDNQNDDNEIGLLWVIALNTISSLCVYVYVYVYVCVHVCVHVCMRLEWGCRVTRKSNMHARVAGGYLSSYSGLFLLPSLSTLLQ